MANQTQKELETLLEKFRTLDKEKDRLTYLQKTRNVSELLQAMGTFVDDDLDGAISTVTDAIDKIVKQAELIEKIFEIANATPQGEENATYERLAEALNDIIAAIEESAGC